MSRPRDSQHNSRAGHPASLRCSSLTNSRFARSSRLAIRAPRSGTYVTNHAAGTLDFRTEPRRWALLKRSLWCGVLLLVPTVAAAQSATNAERDVLAALQRLGQAQAECQVAAQAALRYRIIW